MRLTEFAYKEGNRWELRPLQINPTTLLVGENAAGKSRTLRAIANCANIIAEKGRSVTNRFYSLKFEDNGAVYEYEFRLSGKVSPKSPCQIQCEHLFVGGRAVIVREDECCTFDGHAIEPPVDKLALQVRRDKNEYPFIEKIIKWAESLSFIPFTQMREKYADEGGDFSICDTVFDFSEEQRQNVVQMVRSVHFNMKRLEPFRILNTSFIGIHEEGIETHYNFKLMSDGMFRTFCLLVLLEHLAQDGLPSMMIIDDLCEGLDYRRSVELGKLLFNFCKEHDISLMVSTNDNFLMDVIDTKDWIILEREGSVVNGISAKTDPELFEEFDFTGLDNFSLFASNMIANYKQSKQRS